MAREGLGDDDEAARVVDVCEVGAGDVGAEGWWGKVGVVRVVDKNYAGGIRGGWRGSEGADEGVNEERGAAVHAWEDDDAGAES